MPVIIERAEPEDDVREKLNETIEYVKTLEERIDGLYAQIASLNERLYYRDNPEDNDGGVNDAG